MPVVQLRPDLTYTATGWTVVGAASAHAALADDSDGSYVQRSGTGVLDLRVADGSPVVPQGARVVGVRTGVRLSVTPSGAPVRADLRYDANQIADGGGRVVPMFDASSSGSGPVWLFAPWRDVRTWPHPQHPGHEWTRQVLDVVALWLSTLGGTGQRVHAAAVEVDYESAPSVGIVAPDAVVTDTTRPTVEITYTDPDDPTGASQVAWEVRLYEGEASPSIDGVAAPPGHIDGSGWTTGTLNRWTTPDLTVGQVYTVLARVSKGSAAPGDLHSPWEAFEFTVDLDTPAAPTVDLTFDRDSARASLAVSDPGGPVAAGWYGVEFRDDPAGPWRWVRGARQVDADGPVVVHDHEVPFGRSREYRVRASAQVDVEVVTSPSTIVAGTLSMPSGSAWLVDVLDPSRLNVPVLVSPERSRTWAGRDVVHTPADLPYGVVESEVPVRIDEWSFLAGDPVGHDQLADAVGTTRTLLFRDDRREHLYLRWQGDRTRVQQGDRAFGVDAFDVSSVEVARPSS